SNVAVINLEHIRTRAEFRAALAEAADDVIVEFRGRRTTVGEIRTSRARSLKDSQANMQDSRKRALAELENRRAQLRAEYEDAAAASKQQALRQFERIRKTAASSELRRVRQAMMELKEQIAGASETELTKIEHEARELL